VFATLSRGLDGAELVDAPFGDRELSIESIRR
jgi:hypothetical protein